VIRFSPAIRFLSAAGLLLGVCCALAVAQD
jgi:hypothetical protein